MTINRESAAAVLRLLTGAFPSPAITEDTARAYLDRMTSPPFTDVGLLLATAEACVDTLDRLPTLHQLLIAYQGAARAKIAEEQHQLERRGIARTSTPQPDSRYGREMIDVLRTALTEHVVAGEGTRGHDHHRGAEHCPVCSRADETAERVRARVGELLKARHIVPKPQPVVTYRCPDCQDRGVVEVDGPAGQLTVRPCARCREDQYQAWSDGKLALRRGW